MKRARSASAERGTENAQLLLRNPQTEKRSRMYLHDLNAVYSAAILPKDWCAFLTKL